LAKPFIAELARRDILAGFPDNTRPEQPVTRAPVCCHFGPPSRKKAGRMQLNLLIPANYCC